MPFPSESERESLTFTLPAPRRAKFPEHADADHHSDDGAHHVAGDPDVDNTVSAHLDRASFSAAGTGNADGALEPGSHRAGAFPDSRGHPATGIPDLQGSLGANGEERNDSCTGLGRR